jgi:hypothetical protein
MNFGPISPLFPPAATGKFSSLLFWGGVSAKLATPCGIYIKFLSALTYFYFACRSTSGRFFPQNFLIPFILCIFYFYDNYNTVYIIIMKIFHGNVEQQGRFCKNMLF